MTAVQEMAIDAPEGVQLLAKKAWNAYLVATIQFVGMLAIYGMTVYWFGGWIGVETIMLMLSSLLMLYHFLLIKSVYLYCDDMGVWMYSGVLPWRRGVRGVKWRDLESAFFLNSFWGWLCGSYTVVVRQRFAAFNEIYVTNIADGREVVATINQQQQARIRDGLPM